MIALSEFEQTYNNLLETCSQQKFRTILADPPWRFQNRTGKLRQSIEDCPATPLCL